MTTHEPVHSPTSSPSDKPDAREPGAARPNGKASRSRAGSAWVGICIAAIVVIALIIFLLQNRQPVLVTFLSLHGTVPLAVALLIAGIGVGIVALVIGTIRIGQLRRQLSQERRG
ncbi:MAG TPA: lipopolysaccharide assembly protein LapA domain-containing protein [Microlunatus sp.]|nr:lipopolysaccharide assembly protein LapA domain-containing protein [Microlunatus sp.]